ncbi:MAG: hypothetical protein K1X68_13615 [Saprospiraceae bacterium]|nr:hypothetical protein [Saprospiraceae bacterium]HMW39289.1 hypothetical protein [Saprospiraceae bacterium]HMZ40948.1 hypothetical protein [Saprospiraceae bacterium]HNC36787.1 hypothetical protein [Saprospiraceae bacterium]HNE63635.1 hypothetical protein [Saprospiraceae bacterium]
MDWINVFFNQGVPMIILGFMLWYFVKPLGDSLVKNINKQTELLDKLLASCEESKKDLEIIGKQLEQIHASQLNTRI